MDNRSLGFHLGFHCVAVSGLLFLAVFVWVGCLWFVLFIVGFLVVGEVYQGDWVLRRRENSMENISLGPGDAPLDERPFSLWFKCELLLETVQEEALGPVSFACFL